MPEFLRDDLACTERRLFERIEAKYPLRLNEKEEPYNSGVYLRDFSAGGVKIITKQKLSRDKDIDFWVDLPDGNEPVHFSGRVVWLKNVGNYVWDAGISFKNIRLMSFHRLLNCHPVS